MAEERLLSTFHLFVVAAVVAILVVDVAGGYLKGEKFLLAALEVVSEK